jgi:antitoxin Phd
MNTTWSLQDATARFSQVVENALKDGPQFVTRRGEKAVVVLSTDVFEKLTSSSPSFKDFLLSCPKLDDEFEFERQKDSPRNIEL